MDETTTTGQQATTQAAKEPTAWEAWNTAVQRFLALDETVVHLQIAHELVKANREGSGDTHAEE